MAQSAITLIGMPGSGKSTLGVLLAKSQALNFMDTDVLIQVREGKTLQEIVDQEGFLRLREVEETAILSVAPQAAVIATGGSAVYSDAAMRHLKQFSCVVHLSVPFHLLKTRIDDFDSRGLAKARGQSFKSLFDERLPLYQRYADITLDCGSETPQATLKHLQAALASRHL